MLKTRIGDWGNSKAVRLPKSLFNDAILEDGAEYKIIPVKNGVTLEKCKEKKKSLADLIEELPFTIDTSGYKFNREEANER